MLLAAPGASGRRGQCILPMRAFLVVFLGDGFGAVCRHGVNTAFARWLGAVFPFYTLFENLNGSFLIGVVDFAFKGDASQHLRLFLTTGLLNGYTMFAAFSLDAALLWATAPLL